MNRKILCVCKGNTCRSPIMEALLTYHLSKNGVTDITVESAGMIPDMDGRAITPESESALKKRGLSMADHQSRFAGNLMLDEFDLILCVDEGIANEMLKISPTKNVRVIAKNKGGIPNPYQQDSSVYNRTCAMIDIEMSEVTAAILEDRDSSRFSTAH